jgi:dTDP-4-dehydrorhamnose 3,5-epimerase
MNIIDLKLKGLKLIKPNIFKDSRGFFLESYNQATYQQHGVAPLFVQDNHSFSQKNTIRGMHYQSEPGQAKLLRVSHGSIFDVAIDIRPSSPTFGQWEGVILDDQNHHQLFIPVGFAHGFCVLSPEAHVIYKVSSLYNPSTEKGFRWNDPTIQINWPTTTPIVSDRDQTAPLFSESHFHMILETAVQNDNATQYFEPESLMIGKT